MEARIAQTQKQELVKLLLTKKFIDHLTLEYGKTEFWQYQFLVENVVKNISWNCIVSDFEIQDEVGTNPILEILIDSLPTLTCISRTELIDKVKEPDVYMAFFDDTIPKNYINSKRLGFWIISPSTINLFLNEDFLSNKEFRFQDEVPKKMRFNSFDDLSQWKHILNKVQIIDRYIINVDTLRNNLLPIVKNISHKNELQTLSIELALDKGNLRCTEDALRAEIKSWKILSSSKVNVKIVDLGSSVHRLKVHRRLIITNYLTIEPSKGLEIVDRKKRQIQTNDSLRVQHNFNPLTAFDYANHQKYFE